MTDTTFDKLAEKNGITAEIEIAELKRQLSDTDYIAIKHSEGWISDEAYSETKAAREAIRARIRILEGDE